jgi:hypothetical protein
MEYLPGLAEVVAGDKQLQHRDVFLTEVKGQLLQAQQLMKHHCVPNIEIWSYTMEIGLGYNLITDL